ncbi:sensor domain-containing diguanylate cyclase [Marinimicrobium sp. C2-29]|uniref:sensor domain-containing diguanylate cyclase n=1 Tax=Marinimicrobium sp. C2-29 TaxID=3139825 RepID=UPI0031386BD1
MTPRVLLGLWLLLIGVPLSATPLPTLEINNASAQPLGQHVVYHVNKDRDLDVDALLSAPEAIDWRSGRGETPNLGLMSDPVWFALQLRSPESTERLLAIAYPPLDQVDIYLAREGEIVQKLRTGDQLPFHSRPIHHRDFVLPLALEAGAEYQLFIRVHTQGALHLPITLWQPEPFYEQTQHGVALQLIFIGIMSALALYNLLLCLVVRDRAYLWYVVYLVSFLLAQVTLRGLGFQYLWPDLPALNNFNLPLLLAISLASVGFFTHSFLDAKQYSRVWSSIILSVGWTGVALTGLSLILPYNVLIALLVVAVTLGAALSFMTGCYLWWKGQPLARLYVIAWSVFLLGNVLYNLEKAGILSYSAFSEHIVQVGTVIQVLLLSLALAQRINLERQQRQQAQEHALAVQREANERLEQRVEERTEELRKAYDKLKEVSQLDGLTQLKNRQFFDQTLEMEWRRNTRERRDISLLMLDVDHFKHTNDTLGHLCGDACLRHLAEICRSRVHRAQDIVARYGGEEFVVLLPCTELVGAMVVAENIRKDIEQGDFHWQGQRIPLTVSIGVASCIPTQAHDIDWLIRHADEALYAAKREGRNRTMIYRAAENTEQENTIVPVEAF